MSELTFWKTNFQIEIKGHRNDGKIKELLAARADKEVSLWISAADLVIYNKTVETFHRCIYGSKLQVIIELKPLGEGKKKISTIMTTYSEGGDILIFFNPSQFQISQDFSTDS